ncbi:hypothetical protein EJ06DRAFT_521390 [Trichodelitschia bisporula]|uniref:EthD domain-containing protein n=1 Tax=Trichodelitschia bisporula TaxID=703511 RepID=A0A6G1HX76_9PEZI|nr:hypothetical protein EJ06DRAFT_521390 [Trichodelitschia bisporula]
MATPGLLFVLSQPKPGGISEDDFNKWYNTVHIQDVVKSGLADLALRYINVAPEPKWRYLAIYRLPDLAKLQDKDVMASIPLTHEIFGGNLWTEYTDAALMPFLRIQTFEGQVEKAGPRGTGLRTVFVEPAEGTDDEFDEWYRKQHLDMLGTVTGFRRSTRYKRAPGAPGHGYGTYLALHEYDEPEVPAEQVKLVVGTEWSRKILGSAQSFQGDLWKLITAEGKVEEKF